MGMNLKCFCNGHVYFYRKQCVLLLRGHEAKMVDEVFLQAWVNE